MSTFFYIPINLSKNGRCDRTEFSSALPNRLFPVQVNFLYQTIFRVQPEVTLPWKEIEGSAKKVLTRGYSELNAL